MAFALPEKPSIAVLPFDNLSGDDTQEHLADARPVALATGLAPVRKLGQIHVYLLKADITAPMSAVGEEQKSTWNATRSLCSQ